MENNTTINSWGIIQHREVGWAETFFLAAFVQAQIIVVCLLNFHQGGPNHYFWRRLYDFLEGGFGMKFWEGIAVEISVDIKMKFELGGDKVLSESSFCQS